MRIAIGQVWHETNTFSPNATGLADFERGGLFVGPEILAAMRGLGEIGGFLAAFDERPDVEVVPILRAWAMPGGRLTDEVLGWIRDRLVAGLGGQQLDGILLALHGSSASESVDDVEGYLLDEIRAVVGERLPIVVSLDHHANVTARMVDRVDGLIGYETEPHDPYETGGRAARLLLRLLAGEIRPAIGWRKIPMLAPVDSGNSAAWPMKAWHDLAREIERRPGAVSASYFPVVPWLDVPGTGWSAVVVTDGDAALADRLAAELAGCAWDLREEFWKHRRIPPAEAVRLALAAEAGPIVICDSSDAVLSGAAGDSTCLLRAILESENTATSLLTLIDPAAVEEALRLGVGAEIRTFVGGKLDPLFGMPVEVRGRVAAVAPQGLASPIGRWGASDMGRSALIEVGGLRLVVCEFRGGGGTSPEPYRRLGVEPADARIVVVKTYFHYEEFAPLLKGVHVADCLGLAGWNLPSFPWRKASRPLYPLDENVAWQADRVSPWTADPRPAR